MHKLEHYFPTGLDYIYERLHTHTHTHTPKRRPFKE